MNPEGEQLLDRQYWDCLWCEKLGVKFWISYPFICCCWDHESELRSLAVEFAKGRLRSWSPPTPPGILVKEL